MLLSTLSQALSPRRIRELAANCGFDLAGVAPVCPSPDLSRYRSWAERGLAGEMKYLTDRRAEVRADPAQLLPGAKTVICTGTVYNGPQPYSTEFSEPELGWIARYAWGEDYHFAIKAKLETLAGKLLETQEFCWRACVDTAPLLERSLARDAGIGWIGKNTCLINQSLGSWILLGELLTTLDIASEPAMPDRCGSCTRCIDACPTRAIIPSPDGRYELDSRLCISYFTIELRGSIPEQHRTSMSHNIFGCDICQDVCPWNRRAAQREEIEHPAPPLERLAELSPAQFRDLFRNTAISRARYSGFLRNVAIAMGNAGLEKFRQPLQKMAALDDALIAEHARWALGQLPVRTPCSS